MFEQLIQACSIAMPATHMKAIMHVESSKNPYAIGVVGGRLQRQPQNLKEAVATATALEQGGWNYSMGLVQINKYNLKAYGLDLEAVFNPCANISTGAKILRSCYDRAGNIYKAYSCYYSGNFTRGFKPDFGPTSYVQRVSRAYNKVNEKQANLAIPVIPTSTAKRPSQTANKPIAQKTAPATSAQTPSDETEINKPTSQHPPTNAKSRKSWDVFSELAP